MAIVVVKPDDWQMEPCERRHPGMQIKDSYPFTRLLLSEPNCYTPPHSHSEPELIIVLSGRLLFNGQWCETGTVVYVPANEDYWHSTGTGSCVMALVRPNDRGKIRHTESGAAAQ
jgi:quercetin dioxygenase-like cupin family protein